MATPEHVVTVTKDRLGLWTVTCSVCGRLGGPYDWIKLAMNRKSTHDRGQDAGAD